ncbi:MAG: hypothetical protein KKC79_12235, partial [Gammaproteobacteria bacterium]|nr:hypothetical protein [Gammaproteobacteria bacterium]
TRLDEGQHLRRVAPLRPQLVRRTNCELADGLDKLLSYVTGSPKLRVPSSFETWLSGPRLRSLADAHRRQKAREQPSIPSERHLQGPPAQKF